MVSHKRFFKFTKHFLKKSVNCIIFLYFPGFLFLFFVKNIWIGFTASWEYCSFTGFFFLSGTKVPSNPHLRMLGFLCDIYPPVWKANSQQSVKETPSVQRQRRTADTFTFLQVLVYQKQCCWKFNTSHPVIFLYGWAGVRRNHFRMEINICFAAHQQAQ